MPSKKIVCLGGGSLYFPGAIADIAVQSELAGSEIVLYDIDAEKLEHMRRVCQRLTRQAGTKMRVRSTTRLEDAVDGADFALSSIGGSGAEVTSNVYGSTFHNADVNIPAKYGIQQIIGDTCGPAAMMMAFRSIRVYLRICRELEKRSPHVVFFNHSNPMAVLMRAIHKYTSINAIGVCHGVQGGIARTAQFFGVDPADLQCTWIGTNHYYWFTRVLHKGRDIYPELLEKVRTQPAPKGNVLAYQLSAIYDHVIVYAQDDHIIEFYPFLAQVRDLKELSESLIEAHREHTSDKGPLAKKSSKDERAAFFKQYRKLIDYAQLPKKNDRHALFGEEIGSTLAAIATGQRRIFIANIANNGAIPNLPAEAEVEVESFTDYSGVRAISMGPCPPVLKALLEKRFIWHELVADAAATGNRKLALQALLTDEMAIWPDKAFAMLDELLLASRKLLPQFFRRR